jgi:hypothetical protein
MSKRQPYDAATPFYPEKVKPEGIIERLRGLGFSHMEKEVSGLLSALDRKDAALRAAMEWIMSEGVLSGPYDKRQSEVISAIDSALKE